MPEPIKVYHYHRATGVLLFAAVAQPDPLEPGRLLLPAKATPIAPPAVGPGEAVCFIEEINDWQVVPDLRGRAYYDTATGDRHVIQEVNQSPEPGWTELAPASPGEVWVDDHWELPLATLAANRQADIDDAYSAEMEALLTGYPEAEVKTFAKQEGEARAYLADPAVATPYLDAAAPARGLDKAALVGKIVAKADTLAKEVGTITGKRQALRDAIDAALTAGDRAALATITW